MNIIPKTAIISVSDKTNLKELAECLYKNKIEIISTGGTAIKLKEWHIPYTDITEVTGNPEAFNGRMKSISFQISSGLLFRRDSKEDTDQAKILGIKPIDIVICNLYPFEEVAKNENATWDELIENIDVGGPTMIRSGAKNMKSVLTVTDPKDYAIVIDKINTNTIDEKFRRSYAIRAMSMLANYDTAISLKLSQFDEQKLPELFSNSTKSLRYGENPHQSAKIAILNNSFSKISLANAPVIQGKEVSYNNYLDADQAYKLCSELKLMFRQDSNAVIIKHGIPCGAATGKDLLKVIDEAWECDNMSAFGSVICVSECVDIHVANYFDKKFVEVLIAPHFTQEALDKFSCKKNLRLIQLPLKEANAHEWTARSINGGILIQEEDELIEHEYICQTKYQIENNKLPLVNFGQLVTKFMKSNCLVLVDEKNGIKKITAAGMGQPNRLDCLKLLAGPRLKEKEIDSQNCILISDAFFPFRDSIDMANEWGIKTIVQPGGSIQDKKVIEACDEFGIAMLFTNKRHFRH